MIKFQEPEWTIPRKEWTGPKSLCWHITTSISIYIPILGHRRR